MHKKPNAIRTILILALGFSFACSLGGGLFGESVDADPRSTLATGVDPAKTNTSTIPPTSTKDIGPCNNFIFPLVEGNRWFYTRTSEGVASEFNLLVDAVEGNFATVNALNMTTGLVSSNTVECREGDILSLPASELGLLYYAQAGGELVFEYESGIFLPKEQAFLDSEWDHRWETRLRATGDFTADEPESGGTYKATLDDSPITMTWRTAGANEAAFEPIEVLAGSYPKALKIYLQITMDLDVTLEDGGFQQSIPATIYLECTLWFVPEVGMVKEVVDSADIKTFGFRVPLPVESRMELKEFKPAR